MNAAERDIQLVVFDLGRILVRLADGWSHAAELAGVPVRIDTACPIFSTGASEAVDLNERGSIEPAEFDRRVAALVDELAEQHVAGITAVWLRGCYEGVGDLIDELHTADVQTACLSNTNARHWSQMFDPAAAAGIDFTPLHGLRHRFGSHLMRSRKPDAAIYQQVERETGCPSQSILFFDDLPENIEAARARGWAAECIERGTPETVPVMREHLQRYGVL
jgi:putative hydrolase of the HAD superfamily